MLKKDSIEKFIMSIGMSTGRDISGLTKKIFAIIAFSFALLFLYTAGPPFLGFVEIQYKRGLFILLISIMTIIKFPACRKSPQQSISVLDAILILCTIITFGYWIIEFNNLIDRTGFPTSSDVIMGILAIVICIEVSRRVLGLFIPILVVIVILYAIYGDSDLLPMAIRSPGFSWTYFAAYSYNLEGIFGFILAVIVDYIVLFVVFGAILKALGADTFFIDFPYALTSGLVGGPAKSAVVASCFMGSISGSATANTAATGAFTIPLMIKAGYPKEIAGAVEPAASTGGMFMPPVMGAGAFIMADLLNISYADIVKVAFIPALIYFFSVFMICHFYACGHPGIRTIPKEERLDKWVTFRNGFYYLIPIIFLIILLISYIPPMRAVYWSIVSLLVIALLAKIIKRKDITILAVLKDFGIKLYNGFIEGGEGSIIIGAIAGSIGIVVSSAMVTGLAFTFTSSVMSLSGGSIIIGVLLSLIAAFILGMGLTVTSAYILCAVIVVPAMVQLGIQTLAAHFLVFWFSQTSNVSPPVCVAAFVGASIAKASPYKVGINAMLFSAFLFVMPLLFIYSDILMPNGLTVSVVFATLSGFAAAITYAIAITGYFRSKIGMIRRILLLLVTGLLLFPGLKSTIIGCLLIIVLFFTNNRIGRWGHKVGQPGS